jgi:hypothetical protein
MPCRHAGSSAVAIIALLCLLLSSGAPSLEAQGSDIEGKVQAAGAATTVSA